MRVLVARTDRAGDVILTLPVFSALRAGDPEGYFVALVRSYTAPLAEMAPDVDAVLLADQDPGPAGFLALARRIRHLQFTHAILVHPHPLVMLATFLARIPKRIGRASNVWQFFLTHRLVQRRSRNEQHEFQYNLDLVEALTHRTAGFSPRLIVSDEQREYGRKLLKEASLENRAPVLIHPGHGGSSENIPPSSYHQLIVRLLEAGIPVVVSLGAGERAIANRLPKPVPGSFAIFDDIPDLGLLAGLYTHGSVFAGGSTGPMHLAAALSKPVLAFFPPKPAMKPTRWGPVVTERLIMMPDVSRCPATCAGCRHEPCMATIDMEVAAGWLREKFVRAGGLTHG